MTDEHSKKTIEILLLTTGGTIDGADSDKGTTRAQSDAAKWLSLQNGIRVEAKALMNKDSRDITNADRNIISSEVQNCLNKLVLITHGTWTIVDTARTIKRAIPDARRTILLVGAWVPFGEAESDAPQQMKFALEMLRSEIPGVWIAMDNKLWDPDVTNKSEVSPGKFRLVETPKY